jgi:hypothetical protein
MCRIFLHYPSCKKTKSYFNSALDDRHESCINFNPKISITRPGFGIRGILKTIN